MRIITAHLVHSPIAFHINQVVLALLGPNDACNVSAVLRGGRSPLRSPTRAFALEEHVTVMAPGRNLTRHNYVL